MSRYRENVHIACEAIIDELIYQDEKWPGEEPTVGESIVLIEQYVDRARDVWTTLNDRDALHEIRKVAALAMRAMANHGVLRR